MKKFVEYFINNSLIVNLVSVALVIAGLMFVFSANREAFPKIDFGWVLVQTAYPGATASDVEKLISKPIEDELREVTGGIKNVSSGSYESFSVVAIELEADVANKQKLIQDIKDAVDKVNDLPEDAEDPVVTELNTSEYPVLRVSLLTEGNIENYEEEMEMRRYLKALKDRMINVNGAAKIKEIGYRDREMHVEVDLEKLDRYHIALNEITNALASKNINFPGGIAKENNEDILIRTIGEFETAQEIENIVIRANDIGELVTVGDVASVKDTFEEEEIINKVNGKKSMSLTVLIKENYDIITLVDDVMEIVEEYKKDLPAKYEIVYTDDFSYYVKRRLDVLKGNGLVGLILVVLSLLIALGWRISFVTALGLPIAFAGTFWMMGVYGVSVNLISMFGLIMVLGMLVDDAIIVAENIYRHLEHGQELKKAVIDGTTEVIIPVAGTIMTTIAAFAPMLFMGGIMGKFMWSLPAVVSIALTMSWLESMLILPSHIYDMEQLAPKLGRGILKRLGFLPFIKGEDEAKLPDHLKEPVKKKARKMEEVKHSPLRLRRKYVKVLSVVLRHKIKFLTAISIFFLLTLGFAARNIEFELFPGGGIETMVVLAEAPTGTSLEMMESKLKKIEKVIEDLPEGYVESYISRTGISEQDEQDPDSKSGSKYGSIMINLTPFQKRRKIGEEANSEKILETLRKNTESFSGEFAKLQIQEIQDGPPVGADVSVNIQGEDIKKLKEIGEEFKSYLATIEGVADIKDSFEDEKKEFRVYVNQERAIRTGISVLDVASTIRTYYEGSVATEIKKSEEEIKVRVILPEGEREDLSQLRQIKIANRQGALIPIEMVARFERDTGISSISRKDWRRNLVVTADIVEGTTLEETVEQKNGKTKVVKKKLTSVTANQMLQKKFKDIEKKYPGYTVNYEGEFQDTAESVERLGRSYIIALIAIYIILVALFSNMRQPLIVLSIIPFTMIGVIWSYYFHGLPLSFMAMMGIVGLGGVVVNDSIVYVDFINKARARGKDAFEACLEAGYKRIRPIILTTLTTVLGLLPTAYGWGGFDPFLVPMAVAMAYGLGFGTLITLFGTPAIYNFYYPKSCAQGARACKDPLENITEWESNEDE